MAGNFDSIRQRRFGVETEMTGITRCSAAKAIQKVPDGSIDHVGGSYDKPALAVMIIVPVEKFLKMAEVISEAVHQVLDPGAGDDVQADRKRGQPHRCTV